MSYIRISIFHGHHHNKPGPLRNARKSPIPYRSQCPAANRQSEGFVEVSLRQGQAYTALTPHPPLDIHVSGMNSPDIKKTLNSLGFLEEQIGSRKFYRGLVGRESLNRVLVLVTNLSGLMTSSLCWFRPSLIHVRISRCPEYNLHFWRIYSGPCYHGKLARETHYIVGN